MGGSSKPNAVSTKQRQIAELAKRHPQVLSLNHHLDLEWMREAYRRTRKDGAAGVNGQTAANYEANLDDNLTSLLERAKTGTYRAPPVRRVNIPKPGTRDQTRPLGIPTFEDKVLQRCVTMLLEPIYEQDFLDCSYGFRPGRSAHDAIETLRFRALRMRGSWVLEVDIQKFFDNLDKSHLREFLERRVRDGVILRLIGKWLNAGVMEAGELSYPESGTPQGGVISPLLSNVFLHYVLDEWFEREVKPRLAGQVHLARYADDFVILFECEEDAHRVYKVLPQRFGKYGLTLHPDKTRLVRFKQPPEGNVPGEMWETTKPGTFEFLGFAFTWTRSRQVKQKGRWTIRKKTSSSRFTRGLKKISAWCRENRHQPISAQHEALCQKLRGHYGYFGLKGNLYALHRFREETRNIWQRWLNRRSQRRSMPWARFEKLAQRYPLPKPQTVPWSHP